MGCTDIAFILLGSAGIFVPAANASSDFICRIDLLVADFVAAEHALSILHGVDEPLVLAGFVGLRLVLCVRTVQVVLRPLHLVLNDARVALDVDHWGSCSNLVNQHLLSIRLESLCLLLLFLSLIL